MPLSALILATLAPLAVEAYFEARWVARTFHEFRSNPDLRTRVVVLGATVRLCPPIFFTAKVERDPWMVLCVSWLIVSPLMYGFALFVLRNGSYGRGVSRPVPAAAPDRSFGWPVAFLLAVTILAAIAIREFVDLPPFALGVAAGLVGCAAWLLAQAMIRALGRRTSG